MSQPALTSAFSDWPRVLWNRRGYVLGILATSIVAGLLFLANATYRYTATLGVTPVESEAGGLASQLGNLGGLASLTGVNLSVGQSAASLQLYLESLRSRAVADELAQRDDVMRVVFSNEWDPVALRWRKPRTIVGLAWSGLLRILGLSAFAWSPPDGARLQRYLDDRLTVTQSSKKQVVLISFSHRDPAFASRLLSLLHEASDSFVRQRKLLRTRENIAYLSARLDAVVNVEHQRSLAQALGEQERVLMMASSSAPFAAEPFGAVVTSSKPTSPQPLLVLATSAILGALLGCAAALAIEDLRRRRSRGSNS